MTVMYMLIKTDVSILLATCRGHHGVRPPLEDEVMTILESELKGTSGDARHRKVSNPGAEEEIEDSVTVAQVANGTAIIIRTTNSIGDPGISERTDQSQTIGRIDCRKPQKYNGSTNH
jgi:hypothetical protein